MRIDHISISREQVWDSCKYKYRFKYHLKVDSPVPEQEYFRYGKIIHKVIEIYTKNKGKIQVKDIADSVLKEEKKLSFYYQRQLSDDLSQFLLLSKRIGYEGQVEMIFNEDLDFPNKKYVNGVIDRIVEKNNIIHIIDFKTTKKGQYQKTSNNIIHDLQLQCYAWIASKKLNVPADKIKVALYYLQGAKLVPATFSQNTLDKTPQRLLRVYNDILESNPDTVIGNVGEHCLRCEYNTLCPFARNLKITGKN